MHSRCPHRRLRVAHRQLGHATREPQRPDRINCKPPAASLEHDWGNSRPDLGNGLLQCQPVLAMAAQSCSHMTEMFPTNSERSVPMFFSSHPDAHDAGTCSMKNQPSEDTCTQLLV